MAQVTLYLDDKTAANMKKAARAAGVSQSRWLADLVRQKTAREWAESIVRLFGAWPDLETTPKLRKGQGRDIRRQRC